LKILISAAEASSDAHGAELLRALRAQDQGLEAFGMGGPKLQALGLRSVIDARELLAMGFSEILGRLPKILSALNRLAKSAQEEKPDIAVVIDYPDFHFRLAKRLKKLGVPVVYYIPPKIWVWRKGRVKLLRELFARVLCILPFEEELYRREKVSVKYVGNPLADELPLQMNREEARTRLGLGAQDPVLLLMPGSRPSELKRHVHLMLEASVLVAERLKIARVLRSEDRLKVQIPLPMTADLVKESEKIYSWVESHPDSLAHLNIKVSQGNSAENMIAADVALVKSGTSTLEAGVLGCLHAVVYKPSVLSEWIFKLFIRYKGPVGLVNLVAGWKKGEPYLVREILMDEVTVQNLVDETISLWTDSARRSAMKSGFNALRIKVAGNSSEEGPSAIAAREILSVAMGRSKISVI